jgi:hypothetical protein
MLAVVETHPIQYRAPVYRALANQLQVPLTVIYGSDFSVTGYQDQEFGQSFSWDVDLLSGYSSRFLTQVNHGGAQSFFAVSSQGLAKNLQEINPQAVLITGYNHRPTALPFTRPGAWAYRFYFGPKPPIPLFNGTFSEPWFGIWG